MRYLVPVLAIALAVLPAFDVQARKEPVDVVGFWSGDMVAKLKVKRFAKVTDPDGWLLAAFEDDGTWGALDNDNIYYEGTWVRQGKRKLVLTPGSDELGTGAIRYGIAIWILDLADQGDVDVTDLDVTLDRVKIMATVKDSKRYGKNMKAVFDIKFTVTATVDGDAVITKGSLRSKGVLSPP